MAYVRRATARDATWARAWTADAVADLTTLHTDGLPRHGDVAYVTASAGWYAWMDDGTWLPLSGGSGGAGPPGPPGRDGQDGEDAWALPIAAATVGGDTTVTTTGTIDDLDFANVPIVRMNNASLATIRGLKAGVAGQRVTIISIGAGQVDLAHQNTNSAAANRLINRVTSGVSPLAPGAGAATYEYDAATLRWRLVHFDQGKPLTRTFAAGNYTTYSIGSWTVGSGDVVTEQYLLVGNVMTLMYFYQTTSVANSGGLPTYLLVLLPNGWTCAVDIRGQNGNANDNGAALSVNVVLSGVAVSAISKFAFAKLDGTTWAAATDNTYIQGMAILPID